MSEAEPYAHLVGRAGSITRTVAGDDTAAAMGSGDTPVLATPRLVAWLEAATLAAAGELPPGRTSVGVRVELDHLRASIVGAHVTCTARVTSSDGRTVTFEVTATDADDGAITIARGRMVRAIVDRERFLARTAGTLRRD